MANAQTQERPRGGLSFHLRRRTTGDLMIMMMIMMVMIMMMIMMVMIMMVMIVMVMIIMMMIIMVMIMMVMIMKIKAKNGNDYAEKGYR